MATRTCTACGGTGRVKYRIVSPPKEWEEDCPVCHGTGEIEVKDD